MASKVKENKGKVFTEMEDLAIMAWAEEVGLGVNVNGNIDLVRDQLATGTDEALNNLASMVKASCPEPLRPFGEGGPGTGRGSRGPGRSSGRVSGMGRRTRVPAAGISSPHS